MKPENIKIIKRKRGLISVDFKELWRYRELFWFLAVRNYLPYLTVASCHTKDPIEKVYADKAYFGQPNRYFLHLNGIKDGIMQKDTTTAKLTEIEIKRNKKISKKRYIRFQPAGFQAGGWNSTLV